jgi:hypothetical protein
LLKEAMVDATVPTSPLFLVDDENWRASVEQIVLAPSLHVFLTEIEVRRDMRAKPMFQPDEQYVVSQVVIFKATTRYRAAGSI